MLYGPEIPARAAGVHPNGQADSKQQRRVVRRLLRDLVALAGPVVNNDLAGRSRKPASPRRKPHRVLFRSAERLTDADVDRLIREVGAQRMLEALDRWSQPRFSIAAE